MRSLAQFMTLSSRAYAFLLLAYPAEFREEYGREMILAFDQRCRVETLRSGRLGLVRVWLDVFGDLIRTAPKEDMESLPDQPCVGPAL